MKTVVKVIGAIVMVCAAAAAAFCVWNAVQTKKEAEAEQSAE